MADEIEDALKLIGEKIIERTPQCPLCGGPMPNEKFPSAHPGALSRADNKTEICSNCGQIEAILQMQGENLAMPYPYARIPNPFKVPKEVWDKLQALQDSD